MASFGLFEGKDAIDNGADGASIDESTDLAQLLAVCRHRRSVRSKREARLPAERRTAGGNVKGRVVRSGALEGSARRQARRPRLRDIGLDIDLVAVRESGQDVQAAIPPTGHAPAKRSARRHWRER
jgi:hypothetical protein